MKCQGCDEYGFTNDIGLCDECDSQIQRDLIRSKDFDYAVETAFASPDQREKIRNKVIKKFGSKKEF